MAAVFGTPSATSPAVSAASDTPIPPGTGMKPAKRATMVFTRSNPANEALSPNARRQIPRIIASISWATRFPRNSIVTFDGERSTRSAFAPADSWVRRLAR